MTAVQLRALPEDGIIDHLAVAIAVSGTRRVQLTRAERQLAAAAILARGGNYRLVAVRLHVSGTTARALTARSAENAEGPHS